MVSFLLVLCSLLYQPAKVWADVRVRKVEVKRDQTEEMVINEVYLFQKKTNKNIEVSAATQAVKVMGKISCNAKVSN